MLGHIFKELKERTRKEYELEDARKREITVNRSGGRELLVK